MKRAHWIAIIATAAILIIAVSIAVPLAIVMSGKNSNNSENVETTIPAVTTPVASSTAPLATTTAPSTTNSLTNNPSSATPTTSPQTSAPTATSTSSNVATTSLSPVTSITSTTTTPTTSPSSTTAVHTTAVPTTTAAQTTTPVPTTTDVPTTTAAATTTSQATLATRAPSRIPSWADGALVADVTWSEIPDDTLATEVAGVLNGVIAQSVTVAEADISLSFNQDNATFDLTLQVAATSAQVAQTRDIKQVWYYPALEIITENALVNEVLQDYAFSKQHPDWLQRSLVENTTNSFSDPNVVFWVTAGQESAWVSPNSPWRDLFIARVKALIAAGVNGIWPDVPIYFDGVVQWCDQSIWDRTQFAVDTNNMPFPTSVDWYSTAQSGVSFRRWVAWRHENIAKFLKDVADAASEQSSDALLVVEVVTMDYHDASGIGLDGAYLRDIPNVMVVWEVDVNSEDTGVRYAKEDDWVRLISMYKYARAASGNKPSWAFSYGLREDDAQSVMAEVLIAGNSPYEVKTPNKEKGVDAGVTGSTFRKRWYTWAKTYSDYIFQSPRRSLAKVAVYHSSASRDFVYPQPYGSGLMCNHVKPTGASVWWSTDPDTNCYNQKYVGEYTGMVKALQQSHIPFDLVTSPGLMAIDLVGYDVLMAPLLTAVSNSEANIIANWVNAGGLLIITGSDPTGADEYGTNRTSFALTTALGFDRANIPTSTQTTYGIGTVVFYSDLIGLNYMISSTDVTSLGKLTDPIKAKSPPVVRLPSAHRCVHVEMNQPRGTASTYVVQFSNYVGVCETAVTSRLKTNGTWPVQLNPQSLSVELDLSVTQTVTSVKETDPNVTPPQLTEVTWTMDSNTLKFDIVVSVYKMIVVSFSE